jgi:NADPH:quinone reductase-like Zn-dependent oxidoreductase
MKAVTLTTPGSYEGLTLTERPTPVPGRRDVLIRVRAASLNYRDTVIAKGDYRGPLKRMPVPLSDGAGEVVAMGEDVTRVKIGDRVTANCYAHWIGGAFAAEFHTSSIGMTIDGMLAEHVLVDENARPAHSRISLLRRSRVASVRSGVGLVGTDLCRTLAPGQTVLVQGTGGVALFGLQIARMFGARVLAITSSDAKARKLEELGAEAVVNYKKDPEWSARILELTGGHGVDKTIEIGGATTIQQSAACTRIGGQIGLVGFVTGYGGGLPPITILARTLNIKGTAIGPRASFEALLTAMAVAKTRPVIDSVFPFAEYRQAYRHLESGAHVGKGRHRHRRLSLSAAQFGSSAPTSGSFSKKCDNAGIRKGAPIDVDSSVGALVTAGTVGAQHIGAQVRQQHATEWPGADPGEF